MRDFPRSAVLALVLPALLSAQQPKTLAVPRGSQLQLFQSTGFLNGNRVYCSLDYIGGLCNDFANALGGGGFWPRGTPERYIWNSGLQIAGTIPVNAGGGRGSFGWAGDTVGDYFLSFRGDQYAAEPLTSMFDSRSPEDRAHWPRNAIASDASVFTTTLLGQPVVSDQDIWVRYWDGNPTYRTGDSHPMGVLVEQRAMVWNAPPDNRDIVYFAFTITNITARDPGVYAALGSRVADPWELARLGARFQDSSEASYGVPIPDEGYPIDSVYVALAMDADVGNASSNYSNVILPFGLALAYQSNFLEPSWTFPPEIFGPPFAKAPGFVGAQLVRVPRTATGSPGGLVVFSNYSGSAVGYPNPVGVQQLWRYLSGNSGPASGDNPCTYQGEQLERHYCYLVQSPSDTRFAMSTGPFSLAAGASKTVIVAYVFAPATAAVEPYIGGNLVPGLPSPGDSIAADTTKIRPLERAAGWITQADANGDGTISANEVRTVPHSLLAKARVAQAVVDHKFLLPAPPSEPKFYLIPGDNQVTVVWQKSATETTGDPYFAVASDPSSGLYDPNYRQFDVEGYRIYRGRDPRALQLVAQFDYAGTTMLDYTGEFLYGGECAPELGVVTDCPVPFDTVPPYTVSRGHPLIDNVIQVPVSGRVLLNGRVFVTHTDTAVTGGGSGYPGLADGGVTFAYVDRGVRNAFAYVYAVTAFDVNALSSGPSSQESARVVKSVTPRVAATNASGPVLVRGVFGADGTALDTAAPFPAIDTATGTFSGLIPPATPGVLTLVTPVLEALPAGDIAVRIDSLSAGLTGGIGPAPTAYLTFMAPGVQRTAAVPLVEPSFADAYSQTSSVQRPLVPYDSGAARRFGLALDSSTRTPLSFSSPVNPVVASSPAIATITGRYGVYGFGGDTSRYLAHSRWFDADGPNPPDPTIVAYADPAHNSGHLTGVGRIWAPQAYRDQEPNGGAGPRGAVSVNVRGYSYGATAWYAADFLVTWNADGSITVFDSTYHTTLPFAANGGTGWGFVNVRAFTAAGITSAQLGDGTGTPDVNVLGYHHLYGTPPTCFPAWWNIPCVHLESRAQLEPLNFDWSGGAQGRGIGLMVNGEFFIMEMSALPVAGTRWRLRAVSGAMGASCTPALGTLMTNCSAYTFTPPPRRVAWAPGLTYTITVQRPYTVDSTASGDLSAVHTVPDPYYVTNALETSPRDKVLTFIHLPDRALIRVYSLSGILVAVIPHHDPTGGGQATWDLKSRSGKYVASGVYFYLVETADHRRKMGRFTLVMERP